MKRLEVDCVTGEVTEIDLTPEEVKAYEKRLTDDAKVISDAEEQAKSLSVAKLEASEKLTALGIDPKALGL